MLAMVSLRRFTDEELAYAVRIDPSQVQGLGPSIDALIALLEARRARILATYDPEPARQEAAAAFDRAARTAVPPGDGDVAKRIARAVAQGQLRDLERLWYRLPEGSREQRALTVALERLRERFELDQLASRWAFSGREALDAGRAIEVKSELEEIERLRTHRVGEPIDMLNQQSWLFLQFECHHIIWCFQCQSEYIKSAYQIGNGCRSLYGDFFPGLPVYCSEDISKYTTCSYCCASSGAFDHQWLHRISFCVEKYNIVFAIEVIHFT
jgi:hypothetical protein